MAEPLTKDDVWFLVLDSVRVPPRDRHPFDKKWAQQYWNGKGVDPDDQDTLREIAEGARRCKEQQGAEGVYEAGLTGFLKDGYIEFLDQPAKPEPRAAAPVAQVAPVQQAPKLDDVDAAADALWAEWPKNERPESQRAAKSAVRARARKSGLAEVQAVAQFYLGEFANPLNGMVHPMHLSNLLGEDEEFEKWQEARRRAPTERDRADARAAWLAHPDFEGRATGERDGCAFYLLHVPPADRCDFLLYVQGYGQERRRAVGADPGAAKYGRGFVKTVQRWCADRAAAVGSVAQQICEVCRPLLEVAKREGLWSYPLSQRVESGVTFLAKNRGLGAAASAAYILAQEAAARGKKLDCDALGAQAAEMTYESACRRAGAVIP